MMIPNIRSHRKILWYGKSKPVAERQCLKWRTASPRFTLNAARRMALQRKPSVDPITTDDLMTIWERQKGRCALSDLPMMWGGTHGRVAPRSVSLDRIEPNLNYTRGNVRLICYAINAFRMNMSDSEMMTMVYALIRNAK